MDGRKIYDCVAPEVKEVLAYVAAGYPIRELGDELEKLSGYFQALGIAYLLESADQERFRENLIRSGHARRYFLRKSREESNVNDPRLGLSRNEAFLDVLAAGHMGLAREIAGLSINIAWHADWEYEDDFCFYTFLHRWVLGRSAPETDMRGILTRFETALEGGESPRLDFCKALLARDKDDLRASFIRLLAQRGKENEKALARNQERDATEALCWARSFVSTEGLALLRVAELSGTGLLETGEEFPLCPALAVLPTNDSDCLDMLQSIEQELARER